MLVNYQAPTEADMEWADGVVKRLGVGIPIVRGQKVIIRCAGDELRVRTVWDSDAQRVDICDEETFAILSAGGEADHEPLGFPRRFCFKYDEAISNEFEGKDGLGDEVWSRLKPWTEAVPDGAQATGAVGAALR